MMIDGNPDAKSIAALSCVTAAEDEELDYEASLDIRGENLAASDSKSSKALKHFDTFLKSYCEKIKAPPLHHHQLSYYGIQTSGTNEEANIWWDATIGNFFGYLHTDVYKHGNPDKGRISYETATGYASSIKVHFTFKFGKCGHPELVMFSSTKWRENCLTNYLRSLKRKPRPVARRW
jgi:hypothetical protein